MGIFAKPLSWLRVESEDCVYAAAAQDGRDPVKRVAALKQVQVTGVEARARKARQERGFEVIRRVDYGPTSKFYKDGHDEGFRVLSINLAHGDL